MHLFADFTSTYKMLNSIVFKILYSIILYEKRNKNSTYLRINEFFYGLYNLRLAS